MIFRCWQFVLLGLVLALPAASAGGRALLAPDTSSHGSRPFQASLPSGTDSLFEAVPCLLYWLARAQAVLVSPGTWLQAPRRARAPCRTYASAINTACWASTVSTAPASLIRQVCHARCRVSHMAPSASSSWSLYTLPGFLSQPVQPWAVGTALS